MKNMNPVDLQEWFNANRVEDKMLWKDAAKDQIMFVRDQLNGLMNSGIPYKKIRPVQVISTHHSKSIELPVYELSRPDIGLKVYLRENFYNWKMSVVCETPIEADFSGLFYTTPPIEPDYTGDHLHPVYFEGFPPELKFSYYETSDKCKWSAEIWGDHAMWTTLFILMRSLGVIKPLKWHTKESHRKELDKEYGVQKEGAK